MRLLLLDLDDTLAERPPAFLAWASTFLAETGLATSLDDLVELDEGGHVPRRVFHQRLVERGLTTAYDEFVDAHEEAVSGGYRLSPGTETALSAAEDAGWTLGVVTNGYVRRQTRKLVATGLLDRVAAVCISEEVGTAKPDPAIFALAAERAGVTLEGAWMVGDNLDADITGAANAGLRSVWVQRPREWITFTSATTPDLVAHDVATAIRMVLGE